MTRAAVLVALALVLALCVVATSADDLFEAARLGHLHSVAYHTHKRFYDDDDAAAATAVDVSTLNLDARRRVMRSVEPDQKRGGATVPPMPMIRIGTTHIDYGPEFPWGITDEHVWTMFMAMNRTYTIGGVEYGVELISYLDDEDDDATTAVLVNALVTIDKVHVLFGGYGGDDVTSFLPTANATGIPTLNHGSFDLSFYPPNYFEWVINILPSIATLGYECAIPLYLAGARNFTFLAETDTWLMPGVPFVIEDVVVPSLEAGNLTWSPRQYLNMSSDVWADPSLLDPVIQMIKALNPNVFVFDFGQDNNIIFIDRMRQNNYNPPAYFVFGTGSYPQIRLNLTWEDAGSLISEAYEPFVNFSDPLWGSTEMYNDQTEALFNTTSANSDANLAAALTVLDYALLRVANLTPAALRAEMLTFNGSTVVGTFSFTGGVVNRVLYCFQNNFPNATGILTVWPPNNSSYTPLVYPANITYAKDFFQRLHPKPGLTSGDIVLTAVLSPIGAVLLVLLIGGIVYLVVKRYFHMIFIAKGNEENEEWGA